MKSVFWIVALLLIALLLSGLCAAMPDVLVAGGGAVAMELKTKGVCVVELSADAPKRAGLHCGDVICAVNGQEIQTVEALRACVAQSGGQKLSFTVLRDGQEKRVALSPYAAADGWKLGVRVRDRITGIGTLTFYDPATQLFGALGHGVGDGKSGTLLPLGEGEVRAARITEVTRGQSGSPGALHGEALARDRLGTLSANTGRGIFGTAASAVSGRCLPTADAAQVHTGEASILATVQGTQLREYRIRILGIDRNDRLNRQLRIQVTDPALLAQTGGIVQGMSGSPIIQDGKLIGAVTHVLIQSPEMGYGIFLETMFDAAS